MQHWAATRAEHVEPVGVRLVKSFNTVERDIQMLLEVLDCIREVNCKLICIITGPANISSTQSQHRKPNVTKQKHKGRRELGACKTKAIFTVVPSLEVVQGANVVPAWVVVCTHPPNGAVRENLELGGTSRLSLGNNAQRRRSEGRAAGGQVFKKTTKNAKKTKNTTKEEEEESEKEGSDEHEDEE